jgi:hypothetical protein
MITNLFICGGIIVAAPEEEEDAVVGRLGAARPAWTFLNKLDVARRQAEAGDRSYP